MLEDGLFFNLKEELQYMIFLHQPEFFSITYNGMTMPTTMLFLKQSKDAVKSYTSILLEVTLQMERCYKWVLPRWWGRRKSTRWPPRATPTLTTGNFATPTFATGELELSPSKTYLYCFLISLQFWSYSNTNVAFMNYCSFKSCIKQSVRSKVGCKMPWEQEVVKGKIILKTRSFYSEKSRTESHCTLCFPVFTFLCPFLGRVCSNISEYEEFEALYKDLSLKDKDFIEATTGCLYPCTYLEYRCRLPLCCRKWKFLFFIKHDF